jgi:hypothetical protein
MPLPNKISSPEVILSSLFVSFVPLSVWAVIALQIEPDDEREAAFCLGLLSEAGAHVSYYEGRTIKILGENLSSPPNASEVSEDGRVAATRFLFSSPSPEKLHERLTDCHNELTEITRKYVWHSCGYFSSGPLLSNDWSDREWHEFQILTETM